MSDMKKVILGSVLAAAAAVSVNAQAASASICSGGNAVSASVSGGTNFVKTQFNARCSNNVYLVGQDEATYYLTGAVSFKGKNRFGASSAGGGVVGTGCGATGCTASDASAALTGLATS